MIIGYFCSSHCTVEKLSQQGNVQQRTVRSRGSENREKRRKKRRVKERKETQGKKEKR